MELALRWPASTTRRRTSSGTSRSWYSRTARTVRTASKTAFDIERLLRWRGDRAPAELILRQRPGRRPAPGAEPALRSDALQYDHGDLAPGPLLVLVVVGPAGEHGAPELGLLLRRRRPGPSLEPIALDLDLDSGRRLQVEIPRRVPVGAAPRGHHQVVVAVATVDQRGAELLAGPPAGGGEDEDGRAVPLVADVTVGLDVPLDVLLPEQGLPHGERGYRRALAVKLRPMLWSLHLKLELVPAMATVAAAGAGRD